MPNWVTSKPASEKPINRQTVWKPDECLGCKIVHSCYTCAGFNWKENNGTGIRTTYHCEAHKLEVLASAKLTALRLERLPISELDKLEPDEKIKLKKSLEAIWELIENGI